MITRFELRQLVIESFIRLMTEDEDTKPTAEEPKDDSTERQIGQPLPSTNTPSTSDEHNAADQAHKMGLKSVGGPYWADPKTGKTVAKTVQDKLIKVIPSDDDPYSAPTALGGDKGGRTNRHALGKITGNPDDTKRAISRGDVLSKGAKDAASDGGFGTFKGSELGSHRIQPPLTPEGDPMEISFKGEDGLIDILDKEKGKAHITLNSGEGMWVDTDQLKKRGAAPSQPEAPNKGDKLAGEMEKKYGVEKALTKLRDNIKRLEDQHKFRKNHNSNDTSQRMDSLQDWEATLEKLRHAEQILQQKRKDSLKQEYAKFELD